jgi:hypothetical protein
LIKDIIEDDPTGRRGGLKPALRRQETACSKKQESDAKSPAEKCSENLISGFWSLISGLWLLSPFTPAPAGNLHRGKERKAEILKVEILK